MANHEFLNLERVLNECVIDVYAYLQYIDAKVAAENAQTKFTQERLKRQRR
jgi:hypothetical protein